MEKSFGKVLLDIVRQQHYLNNCFNDKYKKLQGFYSLQACSRSLKSLSFIRINVFIIHLIAITIINGVID